MSKVLLIEDEVAIRSFYTELLKSAGYDVLEAGNGKEGYDVALSQDWDIMLLDIMLPGMDGKKILEEVKKNPQLKDKPIVLLTNLKSEELIRECLALGANKYIVKLDIDPPDKLIDIVGDYFKSSAATA